MIKRTRIVYFFYMIGLICCGYMTALVMSSCAPFQDSPFSDRLLSNHSDINLNAIEKIKDIEGDGKIRIAILADAHQNYGALDKTVYQINRASNIDFVVNLGDFTNSGYNLEYDQYIDSYSVLRKPAITVMGNHDAIGSGAHLFKKAFSLPNFWFESDSKRFIFFSSANIESPEDFNPSWLKRTVEESSKSVFIFTHVNLKDGERFSGDVAQIFSDIINNSKVQAVFNGHNHVYVLDNVNGTVLLQAPRVEGVSWLVVEIQGQQMSITNMADGGTESRTLK